MISKQDIQLVHDKMEIIDIVSSFLSLKKKGTNYIGCCPFHNEKSGSFTVSPSKQIYKCFGCGKAGNAITFVMEHEKYSYPDALKWIAAKYNIEIVEIFKSEEDREKASKADSIFIINKFANEFFKKNLKDSVGDAYLVERGINQLSIDAFSIGYTGDNDKGLYNALIESKYSIDIALAAGLIKERNQSYNDVYLCRVIFPIQNLSGKVIGFGGRTMVTDKNVPKYINSPENEVYHKGSTLYGLYQAKAEIVKLDEAFIVEGYTDVTSLYQEGIMNVVASSGTSLTDNQVRLIKRFTKNLTFLYDGDDAGYKAIVRGIEIALAEDMSIKVIQLPEEHDPDSFIKAMGKDEAVKYFEQNKKDFIQFMYDSNQPLPQTAKDEFLKNLFRMVMLIADDNFFRRKHYMERIGTLFSISQDIISRYVIAVKSSMIKPPAATAPVQEEKPKETMLAQREKEMARLLLKFGDKYYIGESYVCSYIIQNFEAKPDDFYTPGRVATAIIQAYTEALLNNEFPPIDRFVSSDDAEMSAFASSAAIEDDLISLQWETARQTQADGDFRYQVQMGVGLYRIAYLKMQLYMLHNKVDKTSAEWTPDIIAHIDTTLKTQIRNIVDNLGLTNFQL